MKNDDTGIQGRFTSQVLVKRSQSNHRDISLEVMREAVQKISVYCDEVINGFASNNRSDVEVEKISFGILRAILLKACSEQGIKASSSELLRNPDLFTVNTNLSLSINRLVDLMSGQDAEGEILSAELRRKLPIERQKKLIESYADKAISRHLPSFESKVKEFGAENVDIFHPNYQLKRSAKSSATHEQPSFTAAYAPSLNSSSTGILSRSTGVRPKKSVRIDESFNHVHVIPPRENTSRHQTSRTTLEHLPTNEEQTTKISTAASRLPQKAEPKTSTARFTNDQNLALDENDTPSSRLDSATANRISKPPISTHQKL